MMVPFLWILPNILTVLIWLWAWRGSQEAGPVSWKLWLLLNNPFSSAWKHGLSGDRLQELWRVRVRNLVGILLILAVQYGGWLYHRIFILELRIQGLEKSVEFEGQIYKKLEERVHILETPKK